jgi:hypothetical protein
MLISALRSRVTLVGQAKDWMDSRGWRTVDSGYRVGGGGGQGPDVLKKILFLVTGVIFL